MSASELSRRRLKVKVSEPLPPDDLAMERARRAELARPEPEKPCHEPEDGEGSEEEECEPDETRDGGEGSEEEDEVRRRR